MDPFCFSVTVSISPVASVWLMEVLCGTANSDEIPFVANLQKPMWRFNRAGLNMSRIVRFLTLGRSLCAMLNFPQNFPRLPSRKSKCRELVKWVTRIAW